MPALFSFGLPTMEIASGKEPVAIIFLQSRKFVVRRMKLSNNYFILRDGKATGIYEVDPTKAWMYEKTAVFFYDARNAKPLDPPIVNEILHFADKNKLHKVTRKDVKHGAMLRQLRAKSTTDEEAMEKAKVMTQGEQHNIDNYLSEFYNLVEKENEKAEKEKKTPLVMSDQQYSFALTNYLHNKGLLTKEEAFLLEERIRTNSITFDEFIADLKTKEIITIQYPITVDAQRMLDDFHTYDPARLSSHVDTLARLDKKLKTMTSIPVKNWIPASLVIGVAIAIMIGITVMIQQGPAIQQYLHNLMPSGPSPPHLLLGIKSFLMNRFHL